MQINSNSVNPIAYKGICSVGKNKYNRAEISKHLAASSYDNNAAKIKMELLEEVARQISDKTPEGADLYIDVPPYIKTSAFLDILKYHHPLIVYERNGNSDDKQIACTYINSISKEYAHDCIPLYAKDIIRDVKSYYKNKTNNS